MFTKQVQTPKNCFDFEKKVMYFFGSYPLYGKDFTWDYFFRYLITFTFSFGFILSMAFNIYYNLDDSSVVIETLYFGLTQTTYVSKLLNFHIRFVGFQKLEEYLHNPFFNNYAEKQSTFIKNAMRKCFIFGWSFRVCVSVTIVFFTVFPFLDNKLLPLPSYFPVNVKDFRYVLFVYQIVSVIMNGYVHSSLDCIVCILITIGSAQFEILKDNLTNLRLGLDNDYGNREKNDVIVKRRLNYHVQHHVKIIEYSQHIENMFSFVQFVQFLASSIIICVTGFQIIVTSLKDLKFITLVLYFACNLIQVLMCCWFGHDILSKSEGVGEACYMSDWYYCGSSVCRTIFIIMERSKKPVMLTAGKFFNLSLQTLVQVLKTSYSYLALLRRMNEINEI